MTLSDKLAALVAQQTEIAKAIGAVRVEMEQEQRAANVPSSNGVWSSEQAKQWAAECNARTPVKNIPTLMPPGKVLKS